MPDFPPNTASRIARRSRAGSQPDSRDPRQSGTDASAAAEPASGIGGPGVSQDRLLLERYRRWADHYDQSLAHYSEVTLSVAASLLNPLPRQIVDLACGTGQLTARLLASDECRRARSHAHADARKPLPAATLPGGADSEASCQVIGIDISEEMLHHARLRLPRGKGATFLCGRAEEIPLPSHSVHAVGIANAFHLVREPMAALAECHRILVPGGTLVIVDWCRDFLAMRSLAWALALTQRLRRRVEGLEALQNRVAEGGFAVERAFRFRARPLWGMMAIQARSTQRHGSAS